MKWLYDVDQRASIGGYLRPPKGILSKLLPMATASAEK